MEQGQGKNQQRSTRNRLTDASDGIPLNEQDGPPAATAASLLLIVTALLVGQPEAAADLNIVDQVLHGAGLVSLPLRPRRRRTGGDDAGELGVRHVADKVEGEVDDGHDAQPRRGQQRAQIHATLVVRLIGSPERLDIWAREERGRAPKERERETERASAPGKEWND